ncbi:hypothetical protein FZEAL_5994 [Fusarium zealandicum]|uniref:Carrier domain-containing protein n=1 Tax=Fusarium zealandicum TaxID=1053134 RepID=A0A8H4UJ61_9HYPO|nr:hypothetical protein FZEAL_5994 [Fusarium zealandicum]
MDGIDPNYFTCTLGEAARLKSQDGSFEPLCRTVVELIDHQAKINPESPALGFADFRTRPFLSFQELSNWSIRAAQTLSSQLGLCNENESSTTIGLLCTSSVDFVLTWLGLVRLGYSVLLLAPQLEPNAIEHLCKTLQVTQMLVNEAYRHRTDGINSDISILRVPSHQEYTASASIEKPQQNARISDIAYICHTSGTSSGLPKPIPQSQFGVVGAFPSFPGRDKPATFSTTPLYHGGFPDCLRAWTSGAMIWFFPEGHAPITGANLLKAISFARAQSPVPLNYFSSVPHVLQMLAEEDEGVQILQSMDLVGVGGAALPPAVGDKLVDAGVNLLSRMGSAECGFLVSSHRDYGKDKDWQYLRAIDDPQLLVFEPRENGLSELVVKPGWPFKVKTNRDDGSYATSDLFEPHSKKQNAWRYHSRADAQITLANGKKFDPSPIEGSILASTKLLQDVLIFGSGKDYAGALLFPGSEEISESEIIDSVWPCIEQMNAASQSHTRITKAMLVVIPERKGNKPLEKSSKGTILRRQAEERYADAIESAYQARCPSLSRVREIPDEKVSAAVSDCFFQVLGRKIDPYQDLYLQGVDSIACIQIRKLIESRCLPRQSGQLSMNVIYDQGTVTALVEHLRNIRQGTNLSNGDEEDAQLKLMHRLAEKYGDFQKAKQVSCRGRGNVVVLTGATGFLGTHIIHFLRQNGQVKKIICLLRAENSRVAYQRVSESLVNRGMPGLEALDRDQASNCNVVCLPCNLSIDDLGLSDADRQDLRVQAPVIIHSAWAVNFSLRLGSFEDQIAGTRNLINLAAEAGGRFILVSSTAAVSSSAASTIPEKMSQDPSDASPLGYSRSKWVAEQVCDAANDQLTGITSNSQLATIVRVGQLCSNEAGVWNATEAYPLMLSTAKITGCLPDIPNEVLNWLPVEAAARAVLEVAFSHCVSVSEKKPETRTSTPVYHVLNPHNTPTWNQLLVWISYEDPESGFAIVSPREWVTRLEKALGERKIDHPSQALLGMWKHTFGQNIDSEGCSDEAAKTTSKFTPETLDVFDKTALSYLDGNNPEQKNMGSRLLLGHWKDFETKDGEGNTILHHYSVNADTEKNDLAEVYSREYPVAIGVLTDSAIEYLIQRETTL